MHPAISIGLYLLMQLIILALTGWCLKGLRPSGCCAGFRILSITVFTLWCILIVLPVGGTILPEGQTKYFMQRAGNVWLGFNLYFGGLLLLLFCLFQIFRLLIPGTGRKKLRPLILCISFLAAAGLLAYGTAHAQHTVVNTFEVTSDKSAGTESDMKIILIADLHLSVNSHLSTIEKMVDMINGVKPDAVLIAGDIFTSSYSGLRNPDLYAAALRKIQTKYGVFAVYGNHDVEETLFGGFPISPISKAFRSEQMEGFFRECGFNVLYDETALIADGMVQITGRVDGEKAGDGTAVRLTPAEVLKETDPARPVIVLQHEPVEFAALKEAGADLVLCGHTHAGQMFPGNLIVPFFNENAYGYKKVSGVDTVVTSGIGYYGPPMRLGTDSEIAVIQLHFTGRAG